jgi:hypothetical protein
MLSLIGFDSTQSNSHSLSLFEFTSFDRLSNGPLSSDEDRLRALPSKSLLRDLNGSEFSSWDFNTTMISLFELWLLMRLAIV